ncbi:putative O-glycosylation ligase, exosortase A system-associated [Aliiglaciecola sp. 2_MG-2023]|uniref:putative O-glycosylation ligase, exosortase A system-associated n=1 Tax=unclassified Aliiglaciecola TaxID=2593648 RepID=UPI0026E28F37|nr:MULTISPECIES: putative O-glycosylation ligase, exosortase A system-associated [unclassified Aliiglaciecola]MDO6709185.1 putative O-glycosylation ligase, exosortase A system-associated [Aliiglaciecola sp. 2_MG-2023]MDO6750333.1 putative O-glycosylation ligase, exosortase A system-associated [Aliiglaciecola sp. 1_MG-2023]
MRDLLLVGFLFVAIYYSFKRPYIGTAAWVWIALTAPAKWAFGFSSHFRLNLTIVLITVVSYVFVQKYKKWQFNGLSSWVLFFGFWTLVTSIANQTSYSAFVWEYWNQFIKVLLLYFFVTLTVTKRLHVNTVVWAVVLSISSFAAMEAVKFILSGGGHRIVGKAGIIRDRNDLAVAINMCIPLILYLISVTKHYSIKRGLNILLVLNIVAIIGTYSRGGFIGLLILGAAFWWTSKRKLLYGMIAVIALPLFFTFAPGEWKERQNTVSSAAQEDGSFIGRLWAWKISTLIAMDYPLTGGGFHAVKDRILWNYYAPMTPSFGPVDTPPIPPRLRPKAAHNIYMQVLGDHGFIGLFAFMMILWLTLMVNFKNRKWAIANNEKWLASLSSNITLAMIGYGITGNNVSLAYFDLLYAMAGLVCAINIHIVRREKVKFTATGVRIPPSTANSV